MHAVLHTCIYIYAEGRTDPRMERLFVFPKKDFATKREALPPIDFHPKSIGFQALPESPNQKAVEH